jgi:glycosyltransferase involved in cell wall biosynthesis
MRILLLTQYFPPEFGACSARCSEHSALWAAAGNEVQICTGFPNYPDGVIHEAYKGKWFKREEMNGYCIVRSWIYATPNRAVWKRAIASFSFMVSALLSGVFLCRRPDVIIASSGPFFIGPLGYALSIVLRRPYVFEVRDILPQQAIDLGMIKNPVLIRILNATEEFLYRRASVVVAVADASRTALLNRGVVNDQNCVCIENGILEDFFVPGIRENEVREAHGWGNDFIAMYIGVHGVSQGLDTLLDAAKSLRDIAGIRIVFVGDGAKKPELQRRVRELELRNVEFVPPQPKERMPLYYAAADTCLVPLCKGAYFEINIPSKIFESLACCRPVILGARGQAQELLAESGGGICVEPENGNAFAEAVVRLRNEPALCESLGARGRDFVITNFSRRNKANYYIQLLKSLIDRQEN